MSDIYIVILFLLLAPNVGNNRELIGCLSHLRVTLNAVIVFHNAFQRCKGECMIHKKMDVLLRVPHSLNFAMAK